MIRAKINVSKIVKAALFKGQKGTYLSIALIETPNDNYGNDYMVVQDLGEESRQKGEKGPILGNAKTIVSHAQPKPVAPSAPPENEDDVPF